MRALALTIIVLLCVSVLTPCGWDYWEADRYYSLFDQRVISQENYYPFLRETVPYYEAAPNRVSQNRKDWYALLPGLAHEQVDQLMARGTDSPYGLSVAEGLSQEEMQAFDYLRFAIDASNRLSAEVRQSWRYDELKKEKDAPDLETLVDRASKQFKSRLPEPLRIRYAYQIVRALHYSGREEEAIRFFEKRVENKFDKDELYYYTLDQVGGCYYNLEKWDRAATAYLRVFGGSEDRKVSAELSFSWTRRHLQTVDHLLTDDRLRMAYYTIKGYGSFDDPIPAMRELMTLDDSEKAIELLYVRSINKLEQEILHRSAEYTDNNGQGIELFHKTEEHSGQVTEYYGDRLEEMLSLTKDMQDSASLESQDFWKLGESYLCFLKNDFREAQRLLAEVKGDRYRDQQAHLRSLYTVFDWTEMGEDEEVQLARILGATLLPPRAYYDTQPADDAKWIMMSRSSALYLAQGDPAKAYLLHRDGTGLAAQGDVGLCRDLISLLDRPDKNVLEKMMLSRLGVVDDKTSEARDFLSLCLGKQYLKNADEESALRAFRQISAPVTDGIDPLVITEVPAQVFSNNTKECFECPMDSVMTDEVYAAEVFSFITPYMDFEQLTTALITLRGMCDDRTEWKAKLAHYLLGNYYYNVENSGWFRGTLSDHGHCCAYDFFGSATYYFGFAERSIAHYEKAISLSSDPEFIARSYFMIAKCYQNIEYNIEEYDGYVYHDEGYSFSTGYFDAVDSLMILEETAFTQEALKECRHFRYFSTQ